MALRRQVQVLPSTIPRRRKRSRHRHGATPTTAMTHIAIQEALDGKVVEWMEKVSDEEYRR